MSTDLQESPERDRRRTSNDGKRPLQTQQSDSGSRGGGKAQHRASPPRDNSHQVYDQPGEKPDQDLSNKEDTAAKDGGQATKADAQEGERLQASDSTASEDNKKLFTNKADADKKQRGIRGKLRSWRRRAATIGFVLGIMTGGGIGSFLIIKGPLEVIQLAALLSSQSWRTDHSVQSRLGRLTSSATARAAETGEFGETRVGGFESIIFNDARAQLANNGITFETRRQSGRPTKMIIDSNLNSEFSRHATDQAKRAAIAEFFDVDVSLVDIDGPGQFSISTEGKSIKMSRSLVFSSLRTLSQGRIVSALHRRIFIKYFGLPSLFHPFKRLSANAEEQLYSSKASRKIQEETRRLREKARLPEGIRARVSEAQAKINEKISPGAVAWANRALFAADTICLIHDIADDIPARNFAAVAAPATIEAEDKKAVGAATKAGDTTLGQNSAVAESFVDEEGQTIWAAKALNELVHPGFGRGIDIAAELGQAFSEFSYPVGILNFLSDNGASDLGCSTGGQIVLTLTDLALTAATFGGWTAARVATTTATTAASMAAISLATHYAIDFFSANPIEAFAGPQGGNLLAFGARYGSNLAAISMGGVKLADSNTRTQLMEYQEEQRREFQQKSFFARMFDVHDHRSLASAAVRSSGSSPRQLLTNVATSFTNIGGMLSSLSSALMPKAAAQAQPYDWGFPLYGLPSIILENEEAIYADPYENAADVAENILNTDEGEEYIEKARTCFGVDIRKIDELWSVVPIEPIIPTDGPYLDEDCSDLSDEKWIQVTVFVFDTSLATVIECYDGDEDACEIMFGQTTAGASNDTPADLPQGDIQDTAQFLLNSPNVNFLNSNGGNAARQQIQNVASSGSDEIDPLLIRVLAALAQTHEFAISSLRRCTPGIGAGSNSRHCIGKAADISGSVGINGVSFGRGGHNPVVQSFLDRAALLLPPASEIGVPNGQYVGATRPKAIGSNVFYDEGTAPHIHLGVPR